MTPAQLGDLALLQEELGTFYFKLDVFTRRLAVVHENVDAQTMREAMANVSAAEFIIRSTLQKEGRHGQKTT